MDIDSYKEKIDIYFKNKDITYQEYLRKKLSGYRYICVFGVGNMGMCLPAVLEEIGIHVNFFCDNDPHKTGKLFQGIACISVEELSRRKDETVVLIATRYFKEIYHQLKDLGFRYLERIFDNKFAVEQCLTVLGCDTVAKRVKQTLDILGDERSCYILTRIVEEWCRNDYHYGQLDDICSVPQYFDKTYMPLSHKEIFVDCGAYDGDTLQEYIEYTDGCFQKAVLFELSRKNYQKLTQNIQNKYQYLAEKLEPVNYGVAGSTKKISYAEEDEGSGIDKGGSAVGYVTALDDYFADRKATFIKMDIEGAELEALSGARKLITRCKPKLAICIYHKPEDLWEIPLYMKGLMPYSKLLIRHHTDLLNETVCYAIPE